MHHYAIIADDVYTLDNAQERDDAIDALVESGEQNAPIYYGPPGEDGHFTGRYLTTGGVDISSERERLDFADRALWSDGGDVAMVRMVTDHCPVFP